MIEGDETKIIFTAIIATFSEIFAKALNNFVGTRHIFVLIVGACYSVAQKAVTFPEQYILNFSLSVKVTITTYDTQN